MFLQLKTRYLDLITSTLKKINSDLKSEDVKIDCPFDIKKGDLAVPFFALSKKISTSPQEIALYVKKVIDDAKDESLILEKTEISGGYLNIYFDKKKLASKQLSLMIERGGDFAKNDSLKSEKVMVEFSCPNTNKPLHLGHMRNDCLGRSIAQLLKYCASDVMTVNLVNDRGIHICKSMYAYALFAKGKTPESEGAKSDRFVADYYVMYNDWEKEHKEEAQNAISEMLKKWEEGDEETLKLWKKMRQWALDGIEETYKRTNISFDKVYYESELYKFGREYVLKGLKEGVFYRDESGAIMADVDGKQKVLLRSDGTSIYITQDIGTAIKRHDDYPYTSCIYVVGNEQNDHFKTLFCVLSKLKFKWAEKLHQLSYGMVNLPGGSRMKSREGTVVDADDLINSLSNSSKELINENSQDTSEDEKNRIAESVAISALNYFLLSVSPSKDMIFDPKKSISFSGNTGPYLQYTLARINSIFEKAEKFNIREYNFKSLSSDDEYMLILYISSLSDVIKKAALSYDPSLVATYAYNVSKLFSHYYHDTMILNSDNEEEKLLLLHMTREALKVCFDILGIPLLDRM